MTLFSLLNFDPKQGFFAHKKALRLEEVSARAYPGPCCPPLAVCCAAHDACRAVPEAMTPATGARLYATQTIPVSSNCNPQDTCVCYCTLPRNNVLVSCLWCVGHGGA